MCHYEVVAKDTLPEVVSMYPSAFVCNIYDGDKPGEHWVAMYLDEIGDYFDQYGQKPQDAAFTTRRKFAMHERDVEPRQRSQ